MKDESKCRKKTLCCFDVVGIYKEAQVEVCRFCGKKIIYNKGVVVKWDNGNWHIEWEDKIDNKKYMRDHRRDTLQPYGATRKEYIREYGTAVFKKKGKKKKDMKNEWEALRKEVGSERKQI